MNGDNRGAVFLSYASQDAEEAKRIADALRAAGVEVWFDQSELRGGDSWDAAIRKQIKECALFVPIISAHTQERSEGYFRLEWHLAEQRTYLMAHDRPFLFPVVIDGTTDAEARVPEKFRERQWTRLDGRDTPESLARRIVTVLAGESPASATRSEPPAPSPRSAAPRARAGVPAWAWLLGVAGVAAITGFVLFRSRPPAETTAAPTVRTEAARPATAADKLVERATAILDGSALSREQIDTANGLLEQAIGLEPTNAAAWTAAARADLLLIYPYGYDRSEERRQRAMSRATRALNLAPDSHDTRVVRTNVMAHASGNPELTQEAEEIFRRLIQERPVDMGLQLHLAEVLREQRRFEEAAALFEQIGEFELAGWSWTQAGNFATAYEPVKRAVIEKRTTTALQLKTQIELNWFEDLTLAQATINQLRPSELQSDMIVGAATRVAFYRRDPERMLQLLNSLSRDFLDSFGFVGPRQYFTGWAHRLAGRAERAKIEWHKAVTVLQAERATAPDRVRLFVLEAEIHALLGETDEAERLLADAQSIANEAPGTVSTDNLDAYLALGRKEPVLAWLGSNLRAPADRRLLRAHADARFSPIWDGLRGDPRFEELLRETKPADAVPFDDPPAAAEAVVPDAKSIAVLAFANLSDDKGNEYFSDGISEELLNVLAKVPGLTVKGRSSSFFFKGKNTPVPEIAQQLGVTYVVQGSVRKAGNRVRISAQLIRAAADEVVWSSGSMDRDLQDIFAVQDEIAGLVAQQLQLKLATTGVARVVNPEAYRLLLEGRHYFDQRNEDGFARADAAFSAALKIDPSFAEAYTWTAEVALIRANFRNMDGLPGYDAIAPDLGRARLAAQRAIEIDPTQADAYSVLGFVLMLEDRLTESEQQHLKAIALNPNSAIALFWSGAVQAQFGRVDLAIQRHEKASQLDPLLFMNLFIEAQTLAGIRRYDEAWQVAGRAAALRPDIFIPLRGEQARILLGLGRNAEAAAAARDVLRHSEIEPRMWADSLALWVLRQSGFAKEAEEKSAAVFRRFPGDTFQRGFVLTSLGRFDEALPFLEHVSVVPRTELFWNEMWDPYRDEPRFAQLLAKLGLTDAYQVSRETAAKK